MWQRISLRVRIVMLLTALVLITMLGGLVITWYTYHIEELFTAIFDRDVAAFQAAEALENALVNQKGFVTYYFQDGDPDWLRQLGEYRQIFKERLKEALSLAETAKQREAIKRIESEYIQYINSKDQVIAYYKSGERATGIQLHKKTREHFLKVLELCEGYKAIQTKRIKQVKEKSYAQAKRLRIAAGAAMLMAVFFGLFLIFVLINQILGPIRRLTSEADRGAAITASKDEVKALSRSVHGLIEDMSHTQIELERSRETLLQAEKMAMVGKLAAGVAHSVRNPLTSVKMRLFSLSRTLNLSGTRKEDFDVISDEIRNIDTVIQNFLEFARPPKLKIQKISPSEVVDLVIQLLRHRLQSYEVDIKLIRPRPLPEILVDPEQLKEVFINLIENACEAMEKGGLIEIQEDDSSSEPLDRRVTIRLTDNGPGIPESIQEKIFQPFFTTKEEGTGLGLSIVNRIVEEHGGRVDLKSKEGEGATFIVTLPVDRAE